MTLIRRQPPFGDFATLRDTMERLFDERFFRPFMAGDAEHQSIPALDLYTTPAAVIAKVALPGVKPQDMDVSIADDMVTITGSYEGEKETTEAGYIHKELSRGKFQRTFSLATAVNADAATATFKDGVLMLTIPKTETVKPKHVKVEGA